MLWFRARMAKFSCQTKGRRPRLVRSIFVSSNTLISICLAVIGWVTTIVSCLVLLPAAFCARTVKVKVPARVGVPEMTPVFAFRLKPAGRLPAEMFQVMGVVPVA